MRGLALLLIAGCLTKPPPPLDGDAGIDGDAPVAPMCTTPPVRDDFDDTFTTPCGEGFSDVDPSSTITRSGGILEMAVAAGVTTSASCSWNTRFDDGAFIEVRRTLGAGATFTLIQVSVGDLAVGIKAVGDSQLVMFDTAASPQELIELTYVRSDMRWWRIRPEAGVVLGEYSADGRRWKRLATSLTPAPTAATQVHLNAGAFAPLANPASAELDNFNVCP